MRTSQGRCARLLKVLSDFQRRPCLMRTDRKMLPLHSEFEWDDEKAAEGYRLSQARHIINCLCIKAEEAPNKEPIRAFFKIERNESNYNSLETILQSEDSYAVLLRTALSELKAFEKKYKQIKELARVFDELEKITAEVVDYESKI